MVDDTNINVIDGMTDDINSVIENDIGVSVTYTPVVTTTYGADQVSRVDGTTETRSIILYIAGQKYTNLNDGFFLDSDAVAFVKKTESYTRDSKITYGSVTYRIKNVLNGVQGGSGLMFTKRLDLVRVV